MLSVLVQLEKTIVKTLKTQTLIAPLLAGIALAIGCGEHAALTEAERDEAQYGTANVPLSLGSSCGDLLAGECFHLRGWIQVYNAGDTPGVDSPVHEFPTPDGFYEGFPPDWSGTTGLPMLLEDGDYLMTISEGVPCAVGSLPAEPPPESGCYRVWDCSEAGAGTFPAGIGGCTAIQDIATWAEPLPITFTVTAGGTVDLTFALEFMYTQLIFGVGVVNVDVDVEQLTCEEGEVAAEINETPVACYEICEENDDCDEGLCALGLDPEDLLDPEALEEGEGVCVEL